jgi:hypothetical protein
MDCFVACAPLRKRFAFVAGNDASAAWLFALQQFFTKTPSKMTPANNTLLTGNGLSAGFSVLVRLAYKASGTAPRARSAKGTWEGICVG